MAKNRLNKAARAVVNLFSFMAVSIFTASALLFILYATNSVPTYAVEFIEELRSVEPDTEDAQLPIFIKDGVLLEIGKIELYVSIVFPTSTDIAVLEKSLLSGVVHYPESSKPGEAGNVFIFGHSTNRTAVKNKNFTAFTKLHKVEAGDEINIVSNGVVYKYRATKNEVLNPDENRIYLKSQKPMLTLSTCWPVGNPTMRTVVEAEFVKKYLSQ